MIDTPSQYELVDDLPPYSSSWGSDIVHDEKEKKEPTARDTWLLRVETMRKGTERFTRVATLYSQREIWPAIKKFRFSKVQVVGFLLLLLFGILPFFLTGILTGSGSAWFYGLFSEKVISCGDAFGTPQNATVSGIEALFVLDVTFGRYAFSQVKIIDVAWDIGVGRGVQLCAWWVSYKVFSDALLRVIERHPASFETFTHICIEGPCMSTIWSLLKELFSTKKKRTWFLFFYMVIACSYVLSLPTILGAMTGYVSTSIAWIDVGGTEQITPASSFTTGYIIYNSTNTNSNGTCVGEDLFDGYYEYERDQRMSCNCQMSNGTVLPYQTWTMLPYYARPVNDTTDTYPTCIFNYTGNTQTFEAPDTGKQENCNGSYPITIDGVTYEASTINATFGYCNTNTRQGFSYSEIADNTRCLPDTSHPAYQWGFSSMLSGVFLILHFVWSLTMYAVWQDAQFNSALVKSGYAMTMLRAAFALSTAARWKTGMGSRELVTADTKALKGELYGSVKKGKKAEAAEVDVDVFREPKGMEDEEEFELRKRRSTTVRDV